ncbi:hypothetical protein ZORO111903_18125 [Zobellia roscoffensis]
MFITETWGVYYGSVVDKKNPTQLIGLDHINY